MSNFICEYCNTEITEGSDGIFAAVGVYSYLDALHAVASFDPKGKQTTRSTRIISRRRQKANDTRGKAKDRS